LPRETWRAVAAFRFELQTGELPEAVAGGAVDEATVRDAFDLPETISHEGIDDGIGEAVAALARGDREAARETVADAVRTPCENESPETVDADGRAVRCLRYEESGAADPLPRDTDT
jgi:hypothetical protein